MAAVLLTVDLGNTRCKLCVWRAHDAPRSARPLAAYGFESASAAIEEVAACVRSLPGVARIGISAVASVELEHALVRALELAAPGRVQDQPDPGLDVRVHEPEHVGRDRLFAARGAWELEPESAIVLDAGTALTVDALERALPRPRFLGGAIAAGPRLIAEALAGHTARLPLVEPKPGVPALGRDTHAALQSGIAVGFRGAAAELARRIAQECGLAAVRLVITGGAAPFLVGESLCPGRATIHDEHLVHRGILAALRGLDTER